MFKWMGFFILGLLLGALSLLPSCAPKTQDDCGFVQNVYGQRVSWKGKLPIELNIDKSIPAEFTQAVISAAERWNNSSGKKVFTVVQTNAASAAPERDSKNSIYFLKDWEDTKKTEQGRTSLYSIGDEVQEADIRVNAKNFKFYWQTIGAFSDNSSVNLEALLVHEMGHVLGLKHRDSGGSVMATYLAAKTDRVEINQIDLESLKCEY